MNLKLLNENLYSKKGASTDPKNYRPVAGQVCRISRLPVISKITEISIHFQTEDYLINKKT